LLSNFTFVIELTVFYDSDDANSYTQSFDPWTQVWIVKVNAQQNYNGSYIRNAYTQNETVQNGSR
jgi:hypothetical protein